MNTLRRERGFTLIELLVVVAIIGILASVVLASLNNARTKGDDAAIKSNLNNARAQAELYYSTNDSYTGLCADPTILRILNATLAVSPATTLDSNYGNLTDPSRVTCRVPNTAGAQSYMLVAPLSSSAANAWCVDSNGNSKQETNNYTGMNTPNTLTACP